jgi:hypothetical protein
MAAPVFKQINYLSLETFIFATPGRKIEISSHFTTSSLGIPFLVESTGLFTVIEKMTLSKSYKDDSGKKVTFLHSAWLCLRCSNLGLEISSLRPQLYV